MPSDSPTDELTQSRKLARRRSLILPGAGYAVLRRRGAAWRTFLITVAGLAAVAGLCLQPGEVSLLVLLAVGVCGVLLWFGEQRAIARGGRQPGPPMALDRRFFLIALTAYTAAVCLLALAATSFGVLQVSPDSRIGELPFREKLLYYRRVSPAQLQRGTLVAFEGLPGNDERTLDIGRIFAGPGDRVSIEKDHYVINGEPAGKLAQGIDMPAPVPIPHMPDVVTLPSGRYYIVQDSIDLEAPRRLAPVSLHDIVGARFWRIDPGPIGQREE